jgi:hypothetical protein
MNERDLFIEALRMDDPARRAAFLDHLGATDPALRRRLETLLQAHAEASNFLARPAPEQLAGAAPRPAEATATAGADSAGPSLEFLGPPTRPDALGRLGHYEVLEVVGQGGMGVVVRAFDEQLHRVVAIKVLAPDLAASASARQRFAREARAAAAIAHDHVVTIHAVEPDHQPPYLVMHYVAGVSLQDKLDRTGPLGVKEVLRIGLQVAEGLAAAHKQGLVHRDVKPANILLENGVERVKLTDFGLARAVDDASLTQSGVIAGTPLYMAPEQAEGKAVDARADLFSLGSVLYAMCTGHPPFRAGTPLAVLRRVLDDTPRPVREVNPEVPEWLAAIIARLHAKNPAQRYATAAEVAGVLAEGLARLQRPEAAPVVRNPRPRPTLLRRRWAAAAAVVLALAGLGMAEATGVTDVTGTVIRVFHPEGTLVILVDDPNVAVTIDGQDLVITGAGPKEIRLKPGEYRVAATRDGKVVSQDRVSVTRNSRQVVRVTQESRPGAPPAPPAAKADPELDKLVQLAQQKHERIRQMHEVGSVSTADLVSAEVELLEAQLRRAALNRDGAELDRLFAALVAQKQKVLGYVKILFESGRVPQTELLEAEKAVLEAQLRWKESRAARGETGPRPKP